MAVTTETDHARASDAAVLRAVAAGDRSAFVELFGRYAGRIKGFLMRRGASEADAEEIVQEVMVAIWRRAASFDPERAAAATWIFTIARNRRIDLVRRARRPEPDPQDPLFRPDPEPGGVARISAAEREARLRAGLAGLAPEQRQVLVAAFYEGLSHGEIAARLDLPVGTVKSRIRLAFGHLREAIGEEMAGGFGDE
ncbi:MAG TPA: sigma-70 family RNA polymerase sigma factor [Amaricoccus sp.]|uniref:sigma-70 family RNA polymerase sigma factor n=2 Tax=Amaricoccus sp. TaxID=1872485 RepID=UPI001DD3C7F2|nr:sigma-70 family RNA polymerase sigma factor [Amaricoccus sp.]MCB1375443.1 sigma-70 family RNA polymerase sigma factor [Paracoccaceae bacterium]MCB1403378.1 sigma-70 family RNA polymerase sigma factor [Paracoccaceae bacterium]HPG23370.1 sigma-70 family RNA polymerase sigma factor [Amaricoccus sp.]HRW16228.1 sigma-70 family RNA polymerase sigma factor [Amaricoccus sp.]